MAELADAQDLKSCVHYGRAGSSPASGTRFFKAQTVLYLFSLLSRQQPIGGKSVALLGTLVILVAPAHRELNGKPIQNQLRQLQFPIPTGLVFLWGELDCEEVMQHLKSTLSSQLISRLGGGHGVNSSGRELDLPATHQCLPVFLLLDAIKIFSAA